MRSTHLVLSGFLCAGGIGYSNTADAVENFYKGATVSINVGSDAGGGFDLVARVVARHLAACRTGFKDLDPLRVFAGSGALQAPVGSRMA